MTHYGWLTKHYQTLPRGARRVLIRDERRRPLPEALRASESWPQVYALRSSVVDTLYAAGHVGRALRLWSGVVKRFPTAPNPHFQRAHWAMSSGKYAEAVAQLRTCLVKDSGYFKDTAEFWAAEALLRLGRYKEALWHIDRVPDWYEEPWFFGHKVRTKSNLLQDIQAGLAEDA